jgi:putative transposase
VYHVCNRGSRKGLLFETCEDFDNFERLMDEARTKRPMRITGYCLMKTHVHFLLWPKEDGDLWRFMHWLTATHARRWQLQRGSVGTGAVYQSRYVSVPITDDRHLFSALRYVEKNALEAGLVQRAEDWRWCSAWQTVAPSPTFIVDESPFPRLTNWLDILNDVETAPEALTFSP